MTTDKVLFLMPLGITTRKSKNICLNLWNTGKAFLAAKEDIILSKRSVDQYREEYARICIEYDTGIVDV